MIKLTEPSGELYEIKAISDEELQKANMNFAKRDEPFRLCRPQQCSEHLAA